MTRIALVVSDVDGTLLTKDKVLTDKTSRAARQLQDSGVGFTIVSSRPTIGMRFLIEPLRLTLPIGSFNGSSIKKRTIKTDPVIVEDFAPYLSAACKIVGSSSDPALLQRCETAMQQALGTQAMAVRSQSYYLDITPPGSDKGTFVEAIAKRLGIPTGAVATIGDMQNDLAMFRKCGMSIAMGNATDDIKRQATNVTTSNQDEGFAGAIDIVMKHNQA
jgi:hydroxymethylpyrimidine pyrophosphatase-like HAD family hydrolase